MKGKSQYIEYNRKGERIQDVLVNETLSNSFSLIN